VASERKPLTLEDREDISRGLAKVLENKDIAAAIGRSESVVSREINRHGGRAAYRAWKADAEARESRSRPKARKIDADPELRKRVTIGLMKGWSPELPQHCPSVRGISRSRMTRSKAPASARRSPSEPFSASSTASPSAASARLRPARIASSSSMTRTREQAAPP